MITEKLTTLARPYALATFEYALSVDDLSSWESMLNLAATLLDNKSVVRLLSTPGISKKDKAGLFCDVLEKILDLKKKNFITLLAEYDRLPLLPEIARLFAIYRAEHNKAVDVQITSATPLENKYQQQFLSVLEARLKQKVLLQFAVDSSLIGGAIIRTGDRVIDGSIRGKLNRLVEFI